MKYIYPVFVLLVSLIFVFLESRYMTMETSVNYFGVASYGAIALIMLIALFVLQEIIKNKEVYLYLVAGFTFIYVSLLLTTLNNIYIYPNEVTDVIEDLFRLVGFGFVTVGIIKWIRYDEDIKGKLVRLASVDDLTNIMNRRIFDIELRREFANAKRYNNPLSLIMIDIDNFKNVNDDFGHFFGDLVLKMFSVEVSPLLRAGDLFCRWGGDEFAILLPHTNANDAMAVSEKIRELVKKISLNTDNGNLSFTVSLGISEYRPEQIDASEMLEFADRALYSAKESGRDRSATVMDDMPK